MSINVDFSEFDFGALTTFLTIDAVASIVGLAKAYRDIDPIPDESIVIKINKDLRGSTGSQLLSCLLQSGTKVLNAIYYLHARDDEHLKKVFKIVEVSESTPEQQIHAIKCLVGGLVIFISRGQLPATQGNNANTPLPKFITNIMNLKYHNESNLRNALMDFDPKHVSLKKIFDSPDNFRGWDQVLQNRYALGVAGHKPLKAIEALHKYLDVDKKGNTGYELLEALYNAAINGKNGFYPTLHPSIQTFSTKYSQFYRNILRLIFDFMVGNEDTKHERMMNLPMFKPDLFVKNELLKHNLNITGWTAEGMIKDLGHPIKFGDAKSDASKRSGLKFGQSTKSSTSKVVEVEEEEEEVIPPSEKASTSAPKPKTTEKKYSGDFTQNV